MILPVPNTDQSPTVVLLRAVNVLTIKLGKLPFPLGLEIEYPRALYNR